MLTDFKTGTHTYRHADTQACGQTDSHKSILTCRHTGMRADRQTDRLGCRHANMHTDRHACKHTIRSLNMAHEISQMHRA